MSLRGLFQPLILNSASEEGRLYLKEVLCMGELVSNLLPKLPGASWLHSTQLDRWNTAGPLWVSTLSHWPQMANNALALKIYQSVLLSYLISDETSARPHRSISEHERYCWLQNGCGTKKTALDQNHKIGKQVCTESTASLAMCHRDGDHWNSAPAGSQPGYLRLTWWATSVCFTHRPNQDACPLCLGMQTLSCSSKVSVNIRTLEGDGHFYDGSL